MNSLCNFAGDGQYHDKNKGLQVPKHIAKWLQYSTNATENFIKLASWDPSHILQRILEDSKSAVDDYDSCVKIN